MRGSSIILAAHPQGKFLEGVAGDTSVPGTIMQIQAGTAFQEGRPTWVAAAPGINGRKVLCAVLLEDDEQGFSTSQAYVVGTRIRLYVPIPGEEFNCLVEETPVGTGGSSMSGIGERLIINSVGGYLIPEAIATSPEDTIAVAMEAITEAASTGTLTWCMKL